MHSAKHLTGVDQKNLAPCDLLLSRKSLELSEFLAQKSIRMAPANEKSWMAYLSKDLNAREQIAKQFVGYADLCIDGGHNNIDLTDARSTLDWAQFRLKIKVQQDFFEILDKEDLVEVYNSENIQVFRNLRFFNVSNYSLLDLLTYRWDVLFQREDMINRMLIKVADQLQQGQINHTIPVTVPQHTLKEILATEVQTQLVTLKYLSPTTDLVTGKPAGFVASSTAKTLSV